MGSSQEGMVVVVITTQAMLLSAWRSGRQHIAGDGAGQVRAGWFAFAYYCAGFLCWLRSTKHLSPCGFLFSPNRVNDCCMIVLMGGQLLICVRLNATSKQTANYQPLWAPPPPHTQVSLTAHPMLKSTAAQRQYAPHPPACDLSTHQLLSASFSKDGRKLLLVTAETWLLLTAAPIFINNTPQYAASASGPTLWPCINRSLNDTCSGGAGAHDSSHATCSAGGVAAAGAAGPSTRRRITFFQQQQQSMGGGHGSTGTCHFCSR